MTTTRFKGIAIIGAGMMGGLHAEAWRRQPGCAVRRVFDLDTERAKALAAKCGAEWSASAEAAITAPDVQIVSICTPACLHAPLTLLAAQAGRHILCEKPMALTLT